MLKKLLAFICGVVPFGARAADVIEPIPVTIITSPYSGTLNVTPDKIYAVESGNGLVITGTLTNGVALDISGDAETPGDFRVFEDILDQNTGGVLYIGNGDEIADTFSLQVDGNINVSNSLTVNAGRTFSVSGYTTSKTFDAKFGNITADGALKLSDINALTVTESIISANGLTIDAGTVDVGLININSGGATLDVAGMMTVGQFLNNGSGNVDITAGSIDATDIQNNQKFSEGNGQMTITVNGASLKTTGNIENHGESLQVFASGADVQIGGALVNTAGELTLNAKSLKITGINATNPSIVNSGKLTLNVEGETNLAYGFDLNMLDNDFKNDFSLTTGSLVIGSNANMSQLFSNDLNNYSIVVEDAVFDTKSDVINGVNNQKATMYLAAQSLTVQDVQNKNGTVKLVASVGDLKADSVQDNQEAVLTSLTAEGTVTVSGAVTAAGNIYIAGQGINLGSVLASKGVLNVVAQDSVDGFVQIAGGVENNGGNILVSGRQMTVQGTVKNTSGDLALNASDLNGGLISLGGISVSDGSVFLDAKQGINVAQTDAGSQGSLGTGTVVVNDGALNIGSQTSSLNVYGTGRDGETTVSIAGDVTVGAIEADDNGDVNFALDGQNFLLQGSETISVKGDISATDTTKVDGQSVARGITFAAKNFDFGSIDANDVVVGGNITASGEKNSLVFQGIGITGNVINTANLTTAGTVSVSDGAEIEVHTMNMTTGALNENGGAITLYGDASSDKMSLVTKTGGISINNGILFNSSSATVGLNLLQTSDVLLDSKETILVKGGISMSPTVRLTMESEQDINLYGDVVPNGVLDLNAINNVMLQNDLNVGGAFSVSGKSIALADLTNNGFVDIDGNSILLGNVTQNLSTNPLPDGLDYSMNLDAGNNLFAQAVTVYGGTVNITAQKFSTTGDLTVKDGIINLDVGNVSETEADIFIGGDVVVSGDLNQGTAGTGMLNLLKDDITFKADSLDVNGFIADSGNLDYEITGDVSVSDGFNVADGAVVNMNSGDFEVGGSLVNSGSFDLVAANVDLGSVDNFGHMDLSTQGGIKLGATVNTGNMTLDTSADAFVNMQSLSMDTGVLNIGGAGWILNSDLISDAVLYQNTDVQTGFGIFIDSDDFILNAKNFKTAGIQQDSGAMKIVTGEVVVTGDVDVSDLTIAGDLVTDWLSVDVLGSVSGGTKILGLEQMTIGGNYMFDKNSQLLATILAPDATKRNYWSSVSLNDDDTLGKITNATGGQALVQVGGTFTSGMRYDPNFELNSNEVSLSDSQIGIMLNSAVDQGTAIWLLKADGDEGLKEFSNLEKIRNLNVLFCNADGTRCVSYLDSLEDGGAYISVRDTDDDGVSDSLYVVFDPRFGGPVLIEKTKLQPIVERQLDHTVGEYVAAGALDNMIAGQLLNTGYFNRTPIELIPYIFEGTNVERLMVELYNRMEYFVETADGTSLARFSRLVQPREVEQMVGAIVLNEHTSYRSFEDRMFDEFIWNRNRNLKKVWADFDFGMFSQNVTDDKRVYGNRFSLSAGFDWQASEGLIMGLTGRISHMSSDNSDFIDLSYLPEQTVSGSVFVDVADTNIGVGAYLMKTLGEKFRLYGNAFLDMHVLDVTRNQTFVDTIEGWGTAFALGTEWGLMHDWLNQYIVGNLYARAGYNTGFDLTQEAGSKDYMDMEYDGYLTLTPGYSLIAQKRIYPSAWFQIRPYATIGVEYDVLGATDNVRYKFASAYAFSKYDVDLKPLWANIGGGVELLSANGLQFGLDYRYQYNNVMQLHNIRVSGSYRF